MAFLAVACAPTAEASCHYCLHDVVEDCTSDGGDCSGSVEHFASHADEFATSTVEELLRP